MRCALTTGGGSVDARLPAARQQADNRGEDPVVAAMHRDIVAGDLTAAERDEADRLAHAWAPRE